MNILDYSIIGFYLLLFLGIGYFFRENNSSKDYFLGGRSIGWIPLSLSTMATQLSAISFISAPAFVGLKKGGGLQWLSYEFGVPLAMAFLMIFLIPTLYKSGVVSVYAYLEKRFDVSSRLLISFVFQVSRSVATGVMVYTMALILQATTQLNFEISVLTIGVVTLIYSFQGGMKAVIWGDVIQMVLLFVGIVVCLYFGLSTLGGIDSFLANIDHERLNAVDFHKWGFLNANSGNDFGFWPMLIGGFFLYASYYGTDQTQSQRLLSSKDLPTIQKLLLANGIFRFPVTLTYCIMGLVLGTLFMQDPVFQEALNSVYVNNIAILKGKKADLMVPVFIAHYLPHGIKGLLIVAILAAAMSSLSSTVNSLSAVFMEDYLKRFKPNWIKGNYVFLSRGISLFWGLLCLGLAFFAGNIEGTVIEVINKIGSIFFGPILAIFILAIWSKRTSALNANIGLITGVAVNIYLWLFVPDVFWFWWNAIGCICSCLVALLWSFFYPNKKAHERPEIVLNQNVYLLLGYTFLIILFSIQLPKWLVLPT